MTRPSGSVLLVDDEEKLRKALGRALRARGYQVTEAPDGREAQRLLDDRTFDVVLVDNMMPKVSGLELVRELVRSRAEVSRPQIVMMSAYATSEGSHEARALGAVDYLEKPFEIDELFAAVGRAMVQQRHRTKSPRSSLDGRLDDRAALDSVGRRGSGRAS